jgi:hypothetical protein
LWKAGEVGGTSAPFWPDTDGGDDGWEAVEMVAGAAAGACFWPETGGVCGPLGFVAGAAGGLSPDDRDLWGPAGCAGVVVGGSFLAVTGGG